MKGDSREGSAHTPMYNPNILPLNGNLQNKAVNRFCFNVTFEQINVFKIKAAKINVFKIKLRLLLGLLGNFPFIIIMTIWTVHIVMYPNFM